MRLSFNSEANSELEAAQEHYFAISNDLALSFLDEVQRGLQSILETPFAWPPHTQRTRRYLLRRFPYHLVYRVREQDIVIIAVAHEKREASYWLNRTGKPRS